MNDTDRKTNITFSTNLLPLLPDTGNSVVCPYGIAAVLAMAAEGASKESLGEILSALDFRSLDELRASLATAMAGPSDAVKIENAITLMKGNQGVELLDRFKQTMRSRYSAAVCEKNSDSKPSVQLRNVASFKAEWLCKMERDTSQDSCFRNADGSFCRPAYLNCTERLRYFKDKDIGAAIKAVALPYRLNEKEIPFELVLIDCEKPLTEVLLKDVFANMLEEKCDVEFPEFSIGSEFDLIPMMKSLGLKSIFNKEVEAFDRIAPVPLYAGIFEHKAEIKVDECGTVARAVTFMDTYTLACVPRGNTELYFNRPFHYFLRSTASGEILFMGKVNKLRDCERRKVDLSAFGINK